MTGKNNMKNIAFAVVAVTVASVFLEHFRGEAKSPSGGQVLSAETSQGRDWKSYTNDMYGFSVRYPDDWMDPQEETISDQDYNYISRISFGTTEAFNGDTPEGFNVFVYSGDVCLGNSDSIELSGVDLKKSIPHSIANQAGKSSACLSHQVRINGEFFPQEINVYQFAGTNYTFVLVPFLSKNEGLPDHIQAQFAEVAKNFSVAPQEKQEGARFGQVKPNANISTDNRMAASKNSVPAPTNVKKPPVRPRGTMVCPDPSQKPRFSKTKGKHMDEDCCPDPDEWANPVCAYRSSDYSILISAPKGKR